MDPPFKFPSTPSMPLFPISPERANNAASPTHNKENVKTPTNAPIPLSPSLPDLSFSPSSHFRASSDVQGMVARFNSLDIKDHAEIHKKDLAALKRAQMGREEAEEQLKWSKDHVRDLQQQLADLKKDMGEGGQRETKMMNRLDSAMEDIHRTKEDQSRAQKVYEKEIRRARKEAFKSSSAVVKLQEELKATRHALRATQSDVDIERQSRSQKDQDAFASYYELVGVKEQLADAQARIKAVEQERDALKTSLKEEEVSRVAAEGNIALPSPEQDEAFPSPQKWQSPSRPGPGETVAPHDISEISQLRLDLEREKRLRDSANEKVEFMQMECQFQCCSCRVAEHKGLSFVHDGSLDNQIHLLRQAIARKPSVHTGVEVEHPLASALQTRRLQEEEMRSATAGLEAESISLTLEYPFSESSHHEDQIYAPHEQRNRNDHILALASGSPDIDMGPHGTTPQSSAADKLKPTEEQGCSADDIDEDNTPASPMESDFPDHLLQTPNVRTVTTTTTIPLAGMTPDPIHSTVTNTTHAQNKKGPFSTPTFTKRTSNPTPATTTSVPLRDRTNDDANNRLWQQRSATPADYPPSISPSKTLTREEAIERLRQQRREREERGRGTKAEVGSRRAVSHGRALGNATPGKERRDISAPEMGTPHGRVRKG